VIKRAALTLLLVALGLLAAGFWADRRPEGADAWMSGLGLEPREAQVKYAGRPLRVRYVRGGSGPPVLLLHGLASSIGTYRSVFSGLAKDHDTIALDFPGFGGSEIPGDESVSDLPGAVLSFLEGQGLGRTSIVGHSMGGAVAAWIAGTHPEVVDHLALVDAAGFNLRMEERPAILRFGARFGGLLDVLPVRRLFVTRALHQVYFDPGKVTEEEVAIYLAPLTRPGALRAVRGLLSLRPGAGEALHAAIEKVRAPTLVLWGREDRWVPAAQAESFARAIPGARVVLLDACGHMPQEEQPERTLEELRSFLKG
jgi:pimeloyl-ACP methyl ester carboxylesterase